MTYDQYQAAMEYKQIEKFVGMGGGVEGKKRQTTGFYSSLVRQ